MAGDRIFADTPVIQQASTDFNNHAADLAAKLHEINNDITTLQAGWQGSAQDSFEMYVADWRKSYTNIQDDLEGIAATLGKAGLAYGDLDRQIGNAFK